MKSLKIIFSVLVLNIFIILNANSGPVLLVGIDTECGGRFNAATDQLGYHGTVNQWCAIFDTMMSRPCVTGNGILVVGGGKTAGDNMTTFWNLVGTCTGQTITYVNGAAGIAGQSFTGFRMIAVVNAYCGSGQLTQAELNAINARGNDVAAFVNAGGCLFGSTCTPLTNQFGYVAALGSLTVTPAGNIYTPGLPTYNATAQGLAVGLPPGTPGTGINGPWHNTFNTFPAFLQSLATVTPGVSGATAGSVLAIGGDCITIPPPNTDNTCCLNFYKKVTSSISAYNNPVLNYQINATLEAGPNRIKKVDISLVSISQKNSNADCQTCKNNTFNWGMIVPIATITPYVMSNIGLNPLNIASYPGTPFGASGTNYREFTFGSNNGTGIPMMSPNQRNLKFLLGLPPLSPLSCCGDTIDFCVRYKFTDTTCLTCDTLICYHLVRSNSTVIHNPPGRRNAMEPDIETILKKMNERPQGQGSPGSGYFVYPVDTLLSCRSTGRSSLSYVLMNGGPIRVTLLDEKQNPIKEYYNANYKPDQYSYDFADLDLPEGNYSCRIETELGVEIRQFYWKEVPECPCKRIREEQKKKN